MEKNSNKFLYILLVIVITFLAFTSESGSKTFETVKFLITQNLFFVLIGIIIIAFIWRQYTK